MIISADIEKELGNQPERVSRLRQAVDANSASAVGRYLLARAYREQRQPKKTMEVLDPIIKTDFRHVRAYVEYTRAMLEVGEPTQEVCRDPFAVPARWRIGPGIRGALWRTCCTWMGTMRRRKKLWDDAKEQNFSYEERIKRQYSPRDPADPAKRARLDGSGPAPQAWIPVLIQP